jgi:hypothetical protein
MASRRAETVARVLLVLAALPSARVSHDARAAAEITAAADA